MVVPMGRHGTAGAPVRAQNGGASSPALPVAPAAFFTAFFTAFLAGALAAVLLVAAFLAAAFLAPKPRRAGLPVSASNVWTSSRVSEAGSRSLGILPLSLPSLMYGPKRPLSTW